MSRIDEIEAKLNDGHWMANFSPIPAEDARLLLARVKALEAGLAWYADEKSYEYPGGSGNKASPVQVDNGLRARAALAGAG